MPWSLAHDFVYVIKQDGLNNASVLLWLAHAFCLTRFQQCDPLHFDTFTLQVENKNVGRLALYTVILASQTLSYDC